MNNYNLVKVTKDNLKLYKTVMDKEGRIFFISDIKDCRVFLHSPCGLIKSVLITDFINNYFLIRFKKKRG